MSEKIIDCSSCGKPFCFTPAPTGGRRRTRCDECSHHAGESKERVKARRAEVAAGREKALATASHHQLSCLAAALGAFGDTRVAARAIGLKAGGAELEAMAEEARRIHADVIEGDLSALEKRLKFALHLYVAAMIQGLHEVSPRDLPHGLRAAAQVFELIGGGKSARFAEVQLVVVGHDGQPFDPNAVTLEAEAVKH